MFESKNGRDYLKNLQITCVISFFYSLFGIRCTSSVQFLFGLKLVQRHINAELVVIRFINNNLKFHVQI